MIHNIDPRIGGFFLLTGFSFAAFASGFTVCFFDMETVDQCAEVSNMWLERFIGFGNHIIEWFFALFRAIMARQGA
ncbi:MAG: hypothetical protein SFX19_00335 [Alphaproteobacteria bacterium]|nr:hypothetical protein [Alphaproteobacteria bacterium]